MSGNATDVWLGIDLGTQSVRVVAASATGALLAHAAQPLSSRREGVRHEQDAEQWWRATASACRAVVAQLPRAHLRGLAVDGTSGTILLTDQSGTPLTPALMYDDARAEADAAQLNQRAASSSAAVPAAGPVARVQPSWALPKLLWLLRNYRDNLRGTRLAHQVDFINRRLAGEVVASDSSNALKSGYDLQGECWPRELLAELGVPDNVLPPVVRPGTQIGTVCRAAAEFTGIPAGTPVFAGMTDGCAAQIAAGALQPGSWNSVLGTTLVLKGVTTAPLHDPEGVVYSHRSPDGAWLPGAASSSGAGVLQQHFSARHLAALDAEAAQREPATVVTYPLVGRGERFPFRASAAEPFVLGNPVDEIDLYAALLQGVAFIERLCFDSLALLGAPVDGELTLTGGATRSHYWCQLRADVLGRPVRLPEIAEPAFGMAILAASAAHGRSLSETERAMVRIREVIDPRPERQHVFLPPYLQLVGELRRRGWLSAALADKATARVAASDL